MPAWLPGGVGAVPLSFLDGLPAIVNVHHIGGVVKNFFHAPVLGVVVAGRRVGAVGRAHEAVAVVVGVLLAPIDRRAKPLHLLVVPPSHVRRVVILVFQQDFFRADGLLVLVDDRPAEGVVVVELGGGLRQLLDHAGGAAASCLSASTSEASFRSRESAIRIGAIAFMPFSRGA